MARPRQQAGAIPVRRRGKRVEVCLIRRSDSKTWGIPKGLLESGHTLEETALKETWEEAGLEGRLIGAALGTYEFEKWNGTAFIVTVYLMEVQKEHDEWPEDHRRDRRWISFDEASEMVKDHPVLPLLELASERLS